MDKIFDLIQSRYGWTDRLVRRLLVSRFARLTKMLLEVRQDEEKQKYVLAAFLGFQMGAAGQENFGTYLKNWGLSDEAPQETPVPSEADIQAKAAMADARLAGMGITAKKGNGF